MQELIIKTIEAIIFPPGIFIVLLVLGVLLFKNFAKISYGLIIFVTVSLSVLSTSQFTYYLAKPLQQIFVLNNSIIDHPPKDAAIVVLGGGRHYHAPEYHGDDTISMFSLARLRYGAQLANKMHLPLVVSGGKAFKEQVSEGQLMAESAKKDFHVKTVWVEGNSLNTMQNALYSAKLLKEKNIHTAVVVTNAMHMDRALWLFNKTGLKVFAAPMGYVTKEAGKQGILPYLPSAISFMRSVMVLHEYVGALWYRLRY